MGGALSALRQLALMTRSLGDPRNDYVILSEGNTSARADQKTFWIKASASHMACAEMDTFIRVDLKRVLGLLDGPALSVSEMRCGLAAARVDSDAVDRPSIETAMHALCLTMGEATIVGHTHPTAINAVLCAREAEGAFSRPIFPAESLVCGKPLFVPYAQPGQPLAQAVRRALRSVLDRGEEPPRALLLQNHGLVALGDTPQQVLDVTAMMVKTARILVQTHALGGPRFVD
jgi:rhamnose utilization protein RhaD (predicted bifunctional aldolase and dehydrogenase)